MQTVRWWDRRHHSEEGTGSDDKTRRHGIPPKLSRFDPRNPRFPEDDPAPSGNRARQLLFVPEMNLAVLENCPGQPREQQIWTYRYGEQKPGLAWTAPTAKTRPQPPIVEDAVVSVLSRSRVELNWKAPGDKRVAGYQVERALVEVLSEDQLKRLKRNAPPLPEPSVGAVQRIGPFERLTTAPAKETVFTDTALDLGKPQKIQGDPVYERRFHAEELDLSGKPYRSAVFAYRIRSVSNTGMESGPSPAFFTLPSSPQWLFSQEEGARCRLKWAANAEKDLRGYRIYRMDNRWDRDPVSRLTPEPRATVTFTDPAAGKGTRRYYVVAVDALGQEGFPSSPVWANREWRQYYRPFTGEWHQ